MHVLDVFLCRSEMNYEVLSDTHTQNRFKFSRKIGVRIQEEEITKKLSAMSVYSLLLYLRE